MFGAVTDNFARSVREARAAVPMKERRLRARASVARITSATPLLVLAIAALCAVGCPGTLDNPGQFSNDSGGGDSPGTGGSSGVRCNIDPNQVPAQIFTPTCATSS